MPLKRDKVFGAYAGHYDLFYARKDYAREAGFVVSLIKAHRPKAGSILDVGCGTGRHAEVFLRRGFKVFGVDAAACMIEQARLRCPGIGFVQAKAQDFRLEQKFDAVVSLFHVMSYLVQEKDLLQAFLNVGKHLNKGGIFVFDLWYGPGVLTQQPEARAMEYKDGNALITRRSVPEFLPEKNVVRVKYTLTSKIKGGLERKISSEVHEMRYWFLPEIRFFLEQAGFDILNVSDGFSKKKVSIDTWGALIVCRKNK